MGAAEERNPYLSQVQISILGCTAVNLQFVDRSGLLQRFSNEMEMREYSESAIDKYSAAIKMFLSCVHRHPKDIEPYGLREYVRIVLQGRRNLSDKTRNLHIAAIRLFYQTVLERDIDLKLLPRVREGKKIPFVHSKEEIESIIYRGTIGLKSRLALMLAYGCGCRRSEVRCMRIENLRFDENVVYIKHGKGRKDRAIAMPENVAATAREYLCGMKPEGWLFPDAGGERPVSGRTVQKYYENACRKAGVYRPAGIHTLRHSIATHLHEAGVDLHSIQKFLGHSKSMTTEIYLKVSRAPMESVRLLNPLNQMGKPESERVKQCATL